MRTVDSPDVSIIVPTYREAVNLRTLVLRIAETMTATGRPYELLIVDDDSRDGTDQVIAELAPMFPAELITRTEQRDLSLAVLEGLRRARGRILLVMDADLSHPPEQIPELIAALELPPADFALGSRFAAGGSIRDWNMFRWLNSYIATLLARPLTGRMNDPMSGFFALYRATFERAAKLNPIGYKIGLELFCRCRCKHPVEVPITFQNRAHGESKLNLKQQIRYLIHLDRLYRSHHRGWGIVVRPIIASMIGILSVMRAVKR